MNQYTTQSEAKRILAARQAHNDQEPAHDLIRMPAHDDIARRAYDLYVTSGRKQGQSERNWQQAEYDLRDHGINNRTITAIRGVDQDAADIAATRP